MICCIYPIKMGLVGIFSKERCVQTTELIGKFSFVQTQNREGLLSIE